MRSFSRSLTFAARLALVVVWALGLLGPTAVTPVALAGPVTPPANDDFLDATVITLPPTFFDSQDISAATPEKGEPFNDCGSELGASVWYVFSPPQTNLYTFDTFGTFFPHTLGLYTGNTLDELFLFDCESTFVATEAPTGSGLFLDVVLNGGETYYIQIVGIFAAGLNQAQGLPLELEVYAGGHVSGQAWHDLDGDGVREGGEPPLAGVTAVLLDDTDFPIDLTTTGVDGSYLFTNVEPDFDYSVGFVPPPASGYELSPQDQGGDDTLDSDPDPLTFQTITFTVSSLENEANWDAGFGAMPTVSGRAWADHNANGQQDAGEPGLALVDVCLYVVSPCDYLTSTDADGDYTFAVPPDDYTLEFAPPSGDYAYTQDNSGADATDSDPDDTTGQVAPVSLTLGDSVVYDAGFTTTGVGDRVWRDLNEDGVQDPGEPGVAGVTVNLYDDDDALIDSTATGANGEYGFVGLTPDTYYVDFVLPANNSFSPQNAGGDDLLDSDANTGTGLTAEFAVAANIFQSQWDAGLEKASLVVDNLNDYSDETPGDGVCDDNTTVAAPPAGVCSLRAAIEEANFAPDFDVILFLTPTVFSADETIVMTGTEYGISTGMLIQGPVTSTLTIDAEDGRRHFFLGGPDGTQVFIDSLDLVDGDAAGGSGGAIRNSLRLWLGDVVIASSDACTGGGIFNEGELTLSDVLIRLNDGACGGGGIYNDGELTGDFVRLVENESAGDGGGLYNTCSCLVASLTNSLIEENRAAFTGGGVFNEGLLALDDTEVNGNIAGLSGGGIASGELVAGNQTSAPSLCLGPGCGPTPAVTLTNGSLVTNNVAGEPDDFEVFGGGIYVSEGSLLVDDSAVMSNTVYGLGGGIANAQVFFLAAQAPAGPGVGAPTATIQNGSVIQGNTAISTTGCVGCEPFPGLGGGIYNSGLTVVDDSRVLSNTANFGGGAYNETADECFFICASAPAGPPPILFEPTLLFVNGSLVAGNEALTEDDGVGISFLTGSGGGLYNAGHAEVISSEVSLNFSNFLGGGMVNSPPLFEFINPQAPAGLEFLFFQPNLLVQHSLVSYNFTGFADGEFGGFGGGVFNLVGDVVIDDSDVMTNAAAAFGGGIGNGFIAFLAGEQVQAPVGDPGILDFLMLARLQVINGSLVQGNLANPGGNLDNVFLSGGGGLMNVGAAVISDSAVISNSAEQTADDFNSGLGGGILNLGVVTLYGSNVDFNAADVIGGGIANLPFIFGGAEVAFGPMAPGGFAPFNEPPPGLNLEAPLMVLDVSTISNNAANPANIDNGEGDGGGLFNAWVAIIEDSAVSGNQAAEDGAGIYQGGLFGVGTQAPAGECNCDVLRVSDSVIADNQAGRTLNGDEDDDGEGGGLFVEVKGAVTVEDSLISGNSATTGGGGVWVEFGLVFLHNTNLINNNADRDDEEGGNGGGFYNNGGELIIDPTNVIGNAAVNGAGGFFVAGYTLITQTTFATNTAGVNGGGIVVSDDAVVEVANSTFSGNAAGVEGGGVFQEGDLARLTLANVSIISNTAQSSGGGYENDTGDTTLRIDNTLIHGNSSPECGGLYNGGSVSGLNNMGNNAACALVMPGWTTDDPEILPLAYNGGGNGILTHALRATSPAIGTADFASCTDALVQGVDERGANRALNGTCDIGAYEREALTSIELLYFVGKAVGNDSARLRWETTLEIDTAGYNLLRASAPGGPYTQINALLIAATGPGEYEYLDVPGAGTWYYKLEDVDTSDTRVHHGPVEVKVGSGTSSNHRIFLPVVGRAN